MKGKDKVYLTVKVQPRARKPGVEKLETGEYMVRVLAAPSKGEANQEVVERLASHFGLPRSRVQIVRGQTSRIKTVLVELNDGNL